MPNFLHDQSDWTAQLSAASLWFWIAFVSGLSTFLHFTLLHWEGAHFPLVAAYQNYLGLATWVGLGIGFMVGKRRPIQLDKTLLSLAGLVLFVAFALGIQWPGLRINPNTASYVPGLDVPKDTLSWLGSFTLLLALFGVHALSFTPLGQLGAALVARFPNSKASRQWVLGAVVGFLLFGVSGYFWFSALTWFSFALGALLILMGASGRLSPWSAVLAIFIIALGQTDTVNQKTIYSPYGGVQIQPVSDEARVQVAVNQVPYRAMMDLSRAHIQRDPTAQLNAMGYDLPFQMLPMQSAVLIYGAGTGNEVAAALRRGADHIDAVEKDSVLSYLGQNLHPEKPYSDPRVALYEEDPRSFLAASKTQYDLIVFPEPWNLTLEVLGEAKRRLKEKGLMAFSFDQISDRLGSRLFQMLQTTFPGAAPTVVQAGYRGGILFLAGAEQKERSIGSHLPSLANRFSQSPPMDSATDDWPYFSWNGRGYPATLVALAIGFILVAVALLTSVPSERRAGLGSSWVLCLLGAGTWLAFQNACTELLLVYGTTAAGVSGVVSSLGAVSLVAVLAVARWPRVPFWVYFALAVAGQVAGWWVRGSGTDGLLVGGAVASVFCATLPLFSLIQDHGSMGPAVGAVLLGGALGGLLQTLSLWTGRANLCLVAGVLMAVAFVWDWRRRSRNRVTSQGNSKVLLRKVVGLR